jgi:hypothetical protein
MNLNQFTKIWKGYSLEILHPEDVTTGIHISMKIIRQMEGKSCKHVFPINETKKKKNDLGVYVGLM